MLGNASQCRAGYLEFIDIEIYATMLIGFLIWLLLFAASTAALAITIRCIWILRKSLFVSSEFKEKLIPLLKNGDWQNAFEFCEHGHALVCTIAGEVLLAAHEKNDKERQELVSELLDRRVRAILRQFNTLSMCANIAPMLGLLGTVTGMVDAFMGLGTAMGPEKASILAISISQALYYRSRTSGGDSRDCLYGFLSQHPGETDRTRNDSAGAVFKASSCPGTGTHDFQQHGNRKITEVICITVFRRKLRICLPVPCPA